MEIVGSYKYAMCNVKVVECTSQNVHYKYIYIEMNWNNVGLGLVLHIV